MNYGAHITFTIAIFIFLLGAFYIMAPQSVSSGPISQCMKINGGVGTIFGQSYEFQGEDKQAKFLGSTSYKRIRENVWIESRMFTTGKYVFQEESDRLVQVDIRSDRFDVYYPMGGGVLNNKLVQPVISKSRGNTSSLSYYFIDHGLLFLVHKPLNDESKNVLLAEGREFWKTDIYQDVQNAADPVPGEIFYCLQKTSNPVPSATVQPQPFFNPAIGPSEQLQLRSFGFNSTPPPPDPTLVFGF